MFVRGNNAISYMDKRVIKKEIKVEFQSKDRLPTADNVRLKVF